MHEVRCKRYEERTLYQLKRVWSEHGINSVRFYSSLKRL